jgi:hypothetical protein
MSFFFKTIRLEGRLRFRPLLVLILGGLLASTVSAKVEAASIASAQTGNWDVGATWVGGVFPVAGDDVTIASAHTVTVTAGAAAATITVAANASGTNGVVINSGITLNLSGAITMTAPTAVSTSTISVGAGTLNAASIAIPGSATANRNCEVSVSTGTITITGSITFSGTAARAKFTSTGASTTNVAGNFGSGGTLTTSGTGTINFNGGAAQTIGTYTTYNDISINNTSGGVTLTGTTTIGGTLTVTTGTLTVGAFTFTVTGASSASGTLSITSVTGTKTFGNIIVNNGGLIDFTVAENITCNGNLQVDGSGTISGTQGTWTFQKSGGGGTISGTASSITMTDNATFTTSYAVSIPFTVSNTLTVTGTTLTNNTTLTATNSLTGTGGLTQGTGATLDIVNNSPITTLTATANPNTVIYSRSGGQTVTPTAFHHLTLSGSGGKTLTNVGTINGNLTLSGTATATTAIATTVSGNLTVGSGTTFTAGGFDLTVTGTTSVTGTLAHSLATGTKTYVGSVTINSSGAWTNAGNSAITIQGGLTHNGSTFTGGTGTYTFNTNNQAIGGSSAITMGAITVTGVVLTNNSAAGLTASGNLGGTGEMLQGTSATLKIGGTSDITTLTTTANPNTVDYTSNSDQTVKPITYHHLTLSGTGNNIKTLTNVSTINGNLTLSQDCNATTAIAMTIGGNLIVEADPILTVAGFDFTVTGTTSVSGTLFHSSATGTKTHVGSVTINSGGIWTNTGNSAFTFRGGLTHNGATFTSGTGVYTFDTNNQAVGGSSALTITNVTVTTIVLTNNATALTVSTALSGTGELTQGANATLNIGGTSGITTFTATANPNTVNYSGAAQTVRAITYHHLTLSGSAAKTMPGSTLTLNGNFTMSGTCTATAAAAINTAGNFTVGSTNTFTTGAFTHDIKGDFSNSGTFTATGSTITLTGTADQAGGGSATTTFDHLTINKASGAVTVTTTFNVSGTLTFTSGNISTGANKVVITATGTVSRTSGHVVGNLQKNVATGSSVSRTFQIGSASTYTPVDVVFATVSVAGNLTASTTAGDHANIASSDVNSVKSVNRYWTMSQDASLAFTNYGATFNFVAGDVDAGANTSTFIARRYSGGSWSSLTMGTRTATSTQITGATAFGDFQVGNVLSVSVSNSVFAFGTQLLNTWLAAQSSVITNDGTETEVIVGKISTFTAGANTWTLSAVANGADQVRAQWSTTSDTGPWTDISAYDTNFTISSSLAASGTVTFYLRIQTPTSTSSYSEYASTLTVTAQ